MTEPKFTKGPWLIKMNKTFYGEEFIGIYDTQDRLTASAYMHIANANLIAAAPDMYEALKELCNDCPNADLKDIFNGATCKGCPIDNALRKARGEAE